MKMWLYDEVSRHGRMQNWGSTTTEMRLDHVDVLHVMLNLDIPVGSSEVAEVAYQVVERVSCFISQYC
jgi:hypothetical protein